LSGYEESRLNGSKTGKKEGATDIVRILKKAGAKE